MKSWTPPFCTIGERPQTPGYGPVWFLLLSMELHFANRFQRTATRREMILWPLNCQCDPVQRISGAERYLPDYRFFRALEPAQLFANHTESGHDVAQFTSVPVNHSRTENITE